MLSTTGAKPEGYPELLFPFYHPAYPVPGEQIETKMYTFIGRVS
jgi:hypothetical protein